MPEVVSIASVWRDRARVAEEAAAELDELANAAGYVLGANYFGEGCVEGDLLFGALAEYMQSWRGEAAEASVSLRTFAANCRAAVEAFALADGAATDGIR